MTRYLLSIYQPDGDPPPPEVLEPIMRELATVREEMRAAGAWVFTAGLHPPSTATVLRANGSPNPSARNAKDVKDCDVLLTDGPYTEGKEHIGGFTVINADDLDVALRWGRRYAKVLAPLAIEVRPLVEA